MTTLINFFNSESMNIKNLFLVLIFAIGGYYFLAKTKNNTATPNSDKFVVTPFGPILNTLEKVTKVKTPNGPRPESLEGFVDSPVLPFKDVDYETVVIVTPIKCASEDSEKGLSLSAELTRLGIKNVRTDRVKFSQEPGISQQQQIKTFRAMSKTPPTVIVRGRAKANPSVAEIVREYRGTSEPL